MDIRFYTKWGEDKEIRPVGPPMSQTKCATRSLVLADRKINCPSYQKKIQNGASDPLGAMDAHYKG